MSNTTTPASPASSPLTSPPDGVEFGGKNGKQLIATPVVLNRVRRPYLSASTADAVRGCAARMVFERILPRVEDPFGPAELGTSAHSIFEAMFNLPPEERTMSTVAKLMTKLDRSKEGPQEDRGRWLALVNQLVNGIFLVEDPTSIDVIANELKVEAVVNGVPMLGYVDRLGTKNGAVTISDYKSGRVPNIRWGDKHGDQLRLYYAALRESTEHAPTAAEDLYTSFNTVREADLSEDAVTITLRSFKTAWELLDKMLNEATFPTKPSKLCGWCPAQNVCPASSITNESAQPPAPPREDDNPDLQIEPLVAKRTPASPVEKNGVREDVVATTKQAVEQTPAKESRMTEEKKPWEEYDGDELNLNSYAATAAFGLSSMSFDTLKKFNQRTTASSVYALAATFVKIINDANAALGGNESLSFQAGRHTRLRGALHSAIDATPPPFGDDDEAWSKWVTTCTKRVAGVFSVALRLWESPNVATPWEALVRTPATKEA